MKLKWFNLFLIIIATGEARFFENYREDLRYNYQVKELEKDEQPEYSIDDIVKRHRSLTQSARHEVEVFKNPKYDTTCIKKALGPILPKCLKVNIDNLNPELRAITAAKLSICEFEVAKIPYPNECYPKRYFFSSDEDSIDYEDCIISLEKSPQWWTTYSGNYRVVGDICFQEALPYEKDEILNLFLNVTEIYEKILEDLNESIEMSADFKQNSKKSFEELKNFMDEILIKYQKDSDEQKKKYDDQAEEMNKILEKTSSLSKTLSDDILGVTNSVMIQIQTLKNTWDRFFNGDDGLTSELEFMKDYFLNNIEARDFRINQLLDEFTFKLNEISSNSANNVDLSHELGNSLNKNLQNTQLLHEMIARTENSVVSSSKYATNLLATFVELEQLNIGEILNVSEKELLEVFRRITDELSNEIVKVHDGAKSLDEELVVLLDRIGEANVSLVTINDLLKNNILIKIFTFLAATDFSLLIVKIIIIGVCVLTSYYLFVIKVTKNARILALLGFTSLGGIALGISIVKGIKMISKLSWMESVNIE